MSNTQKQPLQATVYAIMSAVGLIGAIAAFIYFNNSIANEQRQNQFYYMILLILGLGVASFLFGAMRSFAKYKGSTIPGALELGGPVVVAALVVWGGFKLLPDQSSFAIKLQLKLKNGKVEELKEGRVWIKGMELKQKAIDQNDLLVNFTEIPSKDIGKQVRFGLVAKGYQWENPDSSYALQPDALIELTVEREPLVIKARVLDEKGDLAKDVAVAIGTSGESTRTDANGLFQLFVPADEQGERIVVYLSKPGYVTETQYIYPASQQPPTFRLTKVRR